MKDVQLDTNTVCGIMAPVDETSHEPEEVTCVPCLERTAGYAHAVMVGIKGIHAMIQARLEELK
jgi:hypothetical protein